MGAAGVEVAEEDMVRWRQVRAARKLLGWSRIKLALQSGVGPWAIRHIENGTGAAGLDEVMAALEAAGVDFSTAEPQMKSEGSE